MDVPLHFRDYWLLPVLNSIRLGKPFYFYRTYVRREDRTPRLWQFLLQATRALLYACTAHGTAFGVIAAAENPKFARPGTRREFQKLGWDYHGVNPHGQHTWIKPF